jgi:hypothetical protein
MTTEEVRALLSNWPWLVVAVVVVWPIVHFLYNHRIASLKEDLERLRARLDEQIAATAISNADEWSNEQEAIPGSSTISEPTPQSDRSPTDLISPPEAADQAKVVLDHSVWTEIMTAYRALPPLERENGIRAAYDGTIIRGSGVVQMVWESVSTIAVLVAATESQNFILSFPMSRRSEVGILREGQRIGFEGLFRSVAIMHIELENPKFQVLGGA